MRDPDKRLKMSMDSVSKLTRMARLASRVGMTSVLALVAGLAQANITDSFTRADSPTIGNGWIEKTPAAFSIQGGAVAKVAAGNGYLDNLVYRPAAEDVLDVEASIEMRLLAANPGYPNVHVRIQSSTAANVSSLNSYILYVDGSSAGAVLGRQTGSGFVTTLADIPVAPAMNLTDTYRLRLRATGTSPVQLSAFIERLSGTSWQIIGQASVNDSAPDRIFTAGSVGFSGYLETAYRFDNFVRTNLTGLPPPPVTPDLVSLSPVSATVGSSAAVVTVNGTGFTPSSVARWNGQLRTTSFVSSTQLQFQLSASDLVADTIGAITVVNNGLVSTPLSFFVVPANTSLFFDGFNRGPSLNVGNGWIEKTPSAFEIFATGILGAEYTPIYDFHDAIVYRPLSESQLNVETGVEFVRTAGGRFPQVHARIQGNSITQPDTLESYILYVEDNLFPTELAIAVQPPIYSVGECIIRLIRMPSTPQIGVRYRLRFQVTGTYPVQLTGIMERFNGGAWELFASGSVVHDANTVEAGFYCPHPAVPPAVSTAGSMGVAKWLDRVDGYDNFYWRSLPAGEAPPAVIPQLTSMSPSSRTAATGGFTLNVTGTNFVSASTVRWNGADRPTTFVSATQLTANISASDVAAVGAATVAVFNPGVSGGLSPQSLVFNITAPQVVLPQVTAIAPTSRSAGSGQFVLTVNGANFIAGSTVRWNGSDRPTTLVSSTQLTAIIAASDVATAGTALISVFNPGGTGGVSPQTLSFTITVPGQTLFFDDFSRADAAALGNGWLEKSPSAFSLEAGRARKLSFYAGYRDNVAYRPAVEDSLNSEVSAEMRLLDVNVGYPQIFARLQSSSVAQSDRLDGYMLYFNASPSQVILGRQVGNAFVTSLATITLSSPLNTTDTFRMRLRVTGTTSVSLQGIIERLQQGAWVVVGQATATDTSAQRISSPGAAAIGGYIEGTYAFDNFSVTALD
jgi:hypothetical protein